MFATFKKLFRKDTGDDLATSIPEAAPAAPAVERPAAFNKSASGTFTSQPTLPVIRPVNAASSPEIVALPLKSVLERLPNSLSSVVQSQGNGFISLPSDRIVQELPKGSVKLSFGELRQIAPAGTFFENARHDQVLVELPLDEILMRMHPSLLNRRSDQKKILVSADITDVFGPRGEGISITGPVSSSPKPAQPGTKATSDTARFALSSLPGAAAAPSANAEVLNVPLTMLAESWPATVQQEIAGLNLVNGTVALPMDRLETGLRSGKLLFDWKEVSSWIQPRIETDVDAEKIGIELPLKLIAPLFLAKHRPAKAQKKIFVGEVPDLFPMKGGQSIPAQPEPEPTVRVVTPSAPIQFVAPVVKPSPIAPAPAPIAPVVPIAPIAPARPPVSPIIPMTPVAKVAPIVAAAPVIPLAPIAPAAPVAQTTPIAFSFPPEAKAPVAAGVAPEPSTLGEILGQPAKRDWTPNEIVKGMAAFPNVSGAFIAMQDGLLVAAQLPEEMKPDTVAAFLPQIFGRMNQYTKEFQMGPLSTLSFTTETSSWQIVKNAAVYLVVVGKADQIFPHEKLQTVAAELGKQIK